VAAAPRVRESGLPPLPLYPQPDYQLPPGLWRRTKRKEKAGRQQHTKTLQVCYYLATHNTRHKSKEGVKGKIFLLCTDGAAAPSCDLMSSQMNL